MTAWICVKAGDVQGIFNQSAKLSGKAHKWLWLATFSSTTNSWLTSAVNMSDYSRFAKTKYVGNRNRLYETKHVTDMKKEPGTMVPGFGYPRNQNCLRGSWSRCRWCWTGALRRGHIQPSRNASILGPYRRRSSPCLSLRYPLDGCPDIL